MTYWSIRRLYFTVWLRGWLWSQLRRPWGALWGYSIIHLGNVPPRGCYKTANWYRMDRVFRPWRWAKGLG